MKEKNEEAVDRVLHGLKARSVPGHLQRRTLQALQFRLAEAEAGRHVPSGRKRLWMPAGVALGAALALLAGVLLFLSTRTVSAPASAPAVAAIPAASSPAVERTPVPETVARPESIRRLPLPHSVRCARASSAGATVREASYPAPPRPLTAQEKMLLQIAQHPMPGEIALLDPVVQARQDALEDAEFAKYVAQSDDASRP